MPRFWVFNLVLAGLLSLFLTGCGDRGGGTARPADRKIDANDDAAIGDLLKDESTVAEAKAWLRDDKRSVVWKGDRRPLLRHFEDLTWAGVKEIYAVSLEPYGDNQEITSRFVAVMPADAVGRARVVHLHNGFWKAQLKDEDKAKEHDITDHGQKYVYYDLDV